MIVAAAVDGAPYDIASRIDPKATERLCGSRYINSGECSIAEEKTMKVTAAVYIETDDVALRVDTLHIGESRARFSDWCKDALAQQETVNVVVMVAIFPRHVASWIDPVQDGESGSGFLDGHKFTVA